MIFSYDCDTFVVFTVKSILQLSQAMSVNPNRYHLKKSYSSHIKVAKKGHTSSHKLLWFYAAECGLKSYYLKINYLKDADSADLKKKFGHNLEKLVKECKIPNLKTPILTLGSSSSTSYPIRDFHEYARYGVNLNPSVEKTQLEYIQQISECLTKLI